MPVVDEGRRRLGEEIEMRESSSLGLTPSLTVSSQRSQTRSLVCGRRAAWDYVDVSSLSPSLC
jgi:hypothetical protein